MLEEEETETRSVNWESLYTEKVECCGRFIVFSTEIRGEKKERGPKYGNTIAERRYSPGKSSSGRWMCADCPTKDIRGVTVFPTTCDRPEATT